MIYLFQDESGDCAFSELSIYRHILIVIVSVLPNYVQQIERIFRYKIASFIKKGWPKNKELKAVDLYRNTKFGKSAVNEVLDALHNTPSLGVNYIIIDKSKITNTSFRNAPYGTAYNYFTGILLSEMIFVNKLHSKCPISLIYDTRNKETSTNKHFNEYLQTKIYGNALENKVNVSLTITNDFSHQCFGLMAADFFSWSLFRKFEKNDDSFCKIFEDKLCRQHKWL
jgi:hypothetical protein